MHNSRTFYQFLKLQDIKAFKVSDFEDYFGEEYNKVYGIINVLVKNQAITKLKNGFYAVNPLPGDHTLPSWHLIAEALVQPKAYYIAFASALQIHELTTQPVHKEYIVTQERILPKKQYLNKIEYEIINLSFHKFFGFQKTWISNYDKVYTSTIEKTIIDCIAFPQHAGGIEAIIRAIDMAKQKIKPNVLVDFALRYKTQSVIKRLGFLLEHLKLFAVEQNILHQSISDAYTKLDPSIKTSGKFHRKWRIEDNVNIHELKQAINT